MSEPEIVNTSVLFEASALRRAAMALTRRLRAERSAGALSSAKLSLLGLLARSGELSPGQLAAADHVQPQSVTRTLAALERDRLVYRRTDPDDRRRAWVGLTQQGRAVLAADLAERDRWLAGQLRRLTPAERAVLDVAADVLERIAAAD